MVCNSEPIEQVDQEQPAGEMPHDERRQARRRRTLKAAKLIPMQCWDGRDGVVRDQSDRGARIAVEEPSSVPDEFRLVVMKEATIQPVTVAGVTRSSWALRIPVRQSQHRPANIEHELC